MKKLLFLIPLYFLVSSVTTPQGVLVRDSTATDTIQPMAIDTLDTNVIRDNVDRALDVQQDQKIIEQQYEIIERLKLKKPR